nr:hypothetical protein [Tanacetum cinerariifolium]
MRNNVTPPDTYSVQAPSGDVTDWYQEPRVMATLVISISSNSSEDSMGTPVGRVILFGTIPTTIPDTTPMITPPTADTPIITPTIPPSPDHTPASLDYSPVFEAESDPSEDPASGHIPPLPATHHSYHQMMTLQTRSPVIPRRRVMILSPGQPIPHGRPYRYHLNGPVHMMTARKRVRPLPVQQLFMRHPVDHSSSDSSSRHSSSDHSSPDLSSTSAGPSRKRRRSPMTSVPALPLVSGALSPVRADLIPPPKRVRDIGYLADVEDDPRETRVERVAHPAIPEDIPEPAQEGAAEVTYETLGDLVQRIESADAKDFTVWLNIEKLDENILQKHGGSKQVGLKQLGSKQIRFKQLGPGVETGFHEVHDEKRVWFEVKLQGAQRDREANVFQVSNDDNAVAQRRLEDKQPEEKTNTDCLVKEQENKHLGVKVGANITVTGVPCREGAEGVVKWRMVSEVVLWTSVDYISWRHSCDYRHDVVGHRAVGQTWRYN